MECLYAKLYDKYDKFKKKKFSEFDEINRDQELNFVNFVTDKALSEEVERLQKFHQERISSCSKDDKKDSIQLNTPKNAQTASEKLSSGSSKRIKRKRSREIGTDREGIVMPSCSGQDDAIAGESAKDLSKGTVSCGSFVYSRLPECCKRPINKSALHQSSGYSFSLTWEENAAGKESELLYRVVSLGTFERVAPEWMREVLVFSTSMCPIFFERIANVIKLHQ